MQTKNIITAIEVLTVYKPTIIETTIKINKYGKKTFENKFVLFSLRNNIIDPPVKPNVTKGAI